MNEKAQELVNQAGEKVLDYLEAGEGFAIEQAPLLAQEIVRYGIWNNTIEIVFWVSLIIIANIVAAKLWKLPPTKDTREPLGQICSIFFRIGSGIALIPLGVSALVLCKVLVAPRLYIIERISNLF